MNSPNANANCRAFQLLDGLALVPATLESRSRRRSYEFVERSLRCKSESTALRPLFSAPFSSRLTMSASLRDEETLGVSAAIHSIGGALNATSQALAKVPLNRLPKRICPIYWDEFPAIEELQTADAVELQMVMRPEKKVNATSRPNVAVWPADVLDVNQLGKKLASIRAILKGQIPVGIAIPAGAVNVDIRLLVKAGVDFVSLVRSPSGMGHLDPVSQGLPEVWQVSAARRAAIEAGYPTLPLFFDVPIRDGIDVIKWIALGASGVIVDSFLGEHLQEPPSRVEESEGGLFSDMGLVLQAPAGPTNAARLAQILGRLYREAVNAIIYCDCENVSQVRSKFLVAIDEASHRLTGVPLLGK